MTIFVLGAGLTALMLLAEHLSASTKRKR